MAYDDRETGLTVEDRGSKLGLPQNQDAEANVLAAMLLSPEVVEEAQVELQPDDFYRPIHKTIYTAMVDMYNSRIPIDSISLIDYLRSINKLDAVGGIHALIEGDLIDGHYLSSVPTNDWIGLYPYVECLAAQAIAAIAVLALFAVGFARKRKLRTPDNRK